MEYSKSSDFQQTYSHSVYFGNALKRVSTRDTPTNNMSLKKKPHHLFSHLVYLSIHPGTLLLHPLKKRFEKKYAGQYKFERTVFLFDLFLIGIILSLALVALSLLIFLPTSFEDDISFRVRVAPHEITSGTSSTLMIQYENNTNEPLREPKLTLSYPKHFFLESVIYNGSNVDEKNIKLDDIPVNGTGTIHIQGVMLGDIDGEQTFKSTLTFTHGKNNQTGHKISAHTFSPKYSSLVLNLSFQKRPVAQENIEGILTYENTGKIDLPQIKIVPAWPEGFLFKEADIQMKNQSFILTNIKAGTKGEIHFKGAVMSEKNALDFSFLPSFVFRSDEYTQEKFAQTIPILPAQIQLTVQDEPKTIIPGSNASFRIHYKHIGDEPLNNIQIGITSKNPFFSNQSVFAPMIQTLQPKDEGDVTITIPVFKTVPTKLLTSFENIQIIYNAFATYSLQSNPTERFTAENKKRSIPLTTPFEIESFARYFTPDGDQIGRGPLPPRVGQKTSYWIFWNIDGTTNPIANTVIEGFLPENVNYSGLDTSSEDLGISFDSQTRKLTWNIAHIPPTLDPNAQIYSVAFKVELTPVSSQINTSPILIKNIQFHGKDAKTNQLIKSSLSDITTNILDDIMAKNKGIVR